jgi:hypothetical protein
MTLGTGAAGSLFTLELLPLGEEAIEFLFISLIADYLRTSQARVCMRSSTLFCVPSARIVR